MRFHEVNEKHFLRNLANDTLRSAFSGSPVRELAGMKVPQELPI
jgi:hypothetical protein